MASSKNKTISLTKESILSSLQEIYIELVQQMDTAKLIQNKMLSMLKEAKDMVLIGPVIEKQQKIINDCLEKKISLAKLQSALWEKSNKDDDDFKLSDLDDVLLQNVIDLSELPASQEVYKLK